MFRVEKTTLLFVYLFLFFNGFVSLEFDEFSPLRRIVKDNNT